MAGRRERPTLNPPTHCGQQSSTEGAACFSTGNKGGMHFAGSEVAPAQGGSLPGLTLRFLTEGSVISSKMWKLSTKRYQQYSAGFMGYGGVNLVSSEVGPHPGMPLFVYVCGLSTQNPTET